MLINQIAVFLENKQGRLHDVVNAVSCRDINIKSLNIADTNDFGIVRMVTSDNILALEALADAGLTASSVDLIGIEVKDAPGTLSEILMILCDNAISVEYIYSYACGEGKTLILLKASNMVKAQKVLSEHKM